MVRLQAEAEPTEPLLWRTSLCVTRPNNTLATGLGLGYGENTTTGDDNDDTSTNNPTTTAADQTRGGGTLRIGQHDLTSERGNASRHKLKVCT